MKCIVDTQLPRRFVYNLRHAGYDALHPLDLLARNATSEQEITDQERFTGLAVRQIDFLQPYFRSSPLR